MQSHFKFHPNQSKSCRMTIIDSHTLETATFYEGLCYTLLTDDTMKKSVFIDMYELYQINVTYSHQSCFPPAISPWVQLRDIR